MGAWGVGLLQDDLVNDVKEEYKILLAYDTEPNVAFNKLLEHFGKDIGEDEEISFWIAIAYINYQYGIEDILVKDKVITMLDDERNMEIWVEQGEKIYNARKKVINKFKNDLLNNKRPYQKPPKPSKALRNKTKYRLGDIVAYRLGSTVPHDSLVNYTNRETMDLIYDKWVLFQVVSIGICPVTRIMPELDCCTFANMALYDRIFETKPEFLPDGAQLIKVNGFKAVYDIAVLEEYVPRGNNKPDISVISSAPIPVKWGNKGQCVDYRHIDFMVYENISNLY